MIKRIFKYTELTILVTLLCGFAAILFLQYGYFGDQQMDQLKTETRLAAAGVEKQGISYLKDLDVDDTRVTLVSKDGTVLFDNKSDAKSMENHKDRPEISDAMKKGTGTSVRYSKTLTTAMLYSAKRLKDGSVLRISESRNTLLAAALGMLQPMIWILIFLMIITALFARRMSRKIVDPLNRFDLNNPLENEEYPELAPFLHRIHDQQQKIKSQTEALKRAEKDFVMVTENMAEGLILLSEDEKVLTINNQAKKLFHAGDECLGRDVLFLERRSDFALALKRAQAGEHMELIMSFTGRSYQIIISPVKADGHVAGMVVLLFDVTDRERAEEMRMEFTSNVSHELKTPLHTISGCAELLESGGVRPEDQKKFVDTIYKQAQRMIDLVEDILYISHLDQGAVDMKWENVDFRPIIDRTVDQLSHEAESRNVTVNVTGNVPEFESIYRLDESIVFNLISNAIKYNKDGGRVDISISDADDRVKFVVADTGIGIPAADQPRIFERFYRADKSHSREIGGTGLGLSIVKHVVELLQADISLNSEPGQGSTFTVFFRKEKPMDM